jgi:hypothetical protein
MCGLRPVDIGSGLIHTPLNFGLIPVACDASFDRWVIQNEVWNSKLIFN